MFGWSLPAATMCHPLLTDSAITVEINARHHRMPIENFSIPEQLFTVEPFSQ